MANIHSDTSSSSDSNKPDNHEEEFSSHSIPASFEVTNFESLINEMNNILEDFKNDPQKAQQDIEKLHKKLQQDSDKFGKST